MNKNCLQRQQLSNQSDRFSQLLSCSKDITYQKVSGFPLMFLCNINHQQVIYIHFHFKTTALELNRPFLSFYSEDANIVIVIVLGVNVPLHYQLQILYLFWMKFSDFTATLPDWKSSSAFPCITDTQMRARPSIVTPCYWICATQSHVTPVAQVTGTVETLESSTRWFCHLRSMASPNTSNVSGW